MRSKISGIGRFSLLGWFGCLLTGTTSWAGPAHYDPDTRSIRFTYTYAALAEGQFGDAAIGAPQTPKPEQDATIRTIVLKVSDALSKATSGRLKISSLDLVPDTKRADLIISMTGDPGRGGWAIAGAIEGRPGQIGLYYQVLAKEWEQDIVLTAAHEVCHYVFGFVDEYNFPSGCPVNNPGGPGCLMDNYLSQGTRHGWYGRLCNNEDHFPNDRSQPESCQSIVDKFFKDRGVTTLGPVDDPAATVLGNEKSKVDNITRAAIGKVREEAESRNKDKKGGSALTSITTLKGFAQTFLKDQFKKNDLGLPPEQVGNLVDGVLKQAAGLVRVAIPARFDPLVEVIGKFAEARAKELREQSPRDSDSARRRKIAQALLTFVSRASGVGNAPAIEGALTPEERRYLDHVAMQAATQTEEEKLSEEQLSAAMAHIKLDRETAGTVLDIAGEVGVVGIENRLAALGEVDADLRKYLPGLTASSGFGRRRTIIIDPDPLDPRMDFVVTQAGIRRYTDLRDEYVELFSTLVQRAKVEILTTEVQKDRLKERRARLTKSTPDRIREDKARRLAELADRSRVRSQREADLRLQINNLIADVRRNRIENIVLLVPAGGLPFEMNDLFESLRLTLIAKGDVRLDLVLVASATVPFALRDIAVGSNGSIISISDVDEVGAVAQRLKNEQSSGAWVILPHEDEIRGPLVAADPDRDGPRPEPWLLKDPRTGRFLGEQPIELPYLEMLSRLDRLIAFFGPGKVGGESLAHTILARAGIMPPVAISVFDQYLNLSLQGTLAPAEGQPWAADGVNNLDAIGLRLELQELYKVIKAFNNRDAAIGPGDDMKYAIIEHLIRARTLYQEVDSLIDFAMASHEPFLAPQYDEPRLFRDALARFKAASAIGDPAKKKEELLRLADPDPNPSEPAKPYKRDVAYLVGALMIREKNAKTRAEEISKATGLDPSQQRARAEVWDQEAKIANADMKQLLKTARQSPGADERKILDGLDDQFVDRMPEVYELNLKLRDLRREYNRGFEAPTRTYIALKLQSLRLQVIGNFIDHIEQEIASSGKTPLYKRFNRKALVQANRKIQDMAPGFVSSIPGQITRPPLPPVDTLDAAGNPRPGAYRLPRFYAENVKFDPRSPLAEFELIVGLSQPLPGVDSNVIRENKSDLLPTVGLYNDSGQRYNTPDLTFDRDLSTPTCLIYRFGPKNGETGWYTAALLLNDKTMRLLGTDTINFTFSVASNRPNFRLSPALVQTPGGRAMIPPAPNRGIVRVGDRAAKVEVQVFGGTSVLGASIRGVLHKIDDGSKAIEPIAQDFHDDGQTYEDARAGDGVYTTLVALDQIEKGVEYRVLIQAESTETSQNIPPEDPSQGDEKRRQDAKDQGDKTVRPKSTEDAKPVKAEKSKPFQRATSIQIRVEQ